jgi:hypothetical protein
MRHLVSGAAWAAACIRDFRRTVLRPPFVFAESFFFREKAGCRAASGLSR